MMAELEKLSATDPAGNISASSKSGNGSNSQQASADPSTVPAPKMPRANGSVGNAPPSEKEPDTSQSHPPAATNRDLLRNTLIALVAGIVLVAAVYLLARRNSGA